MYAVRNTYDEMLKLNITDLTAELDKTTQVIQELVIAIPLRYHVKKDGIVFPVEITIKPYIYKKCNSLLTFIHDISDRKKADEEQLFNQKIISCINSGIVVYDRDLCFQTWNPFMEKLTGLSAHKVVGRYAPEVFPFLHDTGMAEKYKKVLNGETVDMLEYPFVVPETGRSGWASNIVAPLTNINGEIIGVLEAIHDIAERKQAEEALVTRDAKQKAMIANIADVISILDQSGIIKYISPNIEKWFGFSPDEVINNEAWDFVHPDDWKRIRKDFFGLLRKDGNMKTVEFKYKRKDGKYKDIELTWVNHNNDKDINGILVNHHDISSRKKEEEEIVYLSYHDVLTGLYNRTYFEEEMKRLDVARQLPISFIIADINGLKFANDAFGHKFGDKLLKKMAEIIKACLRKEDIVARWGGDEFVVFTS